MIKTVFGVLYYNQISVKIPENSIEIFLKKKLN